MAVLDTDILIGMLRENTDAVNFANSLREKGEKLATTVINAFELLEGSMLHPNKEIKIKEAETLLLSMDFYNFDYSVSRAAAEISSSLKKRGEIIDFQDITIAATAKLHDETLITRNIKHFRRIKGLKIEKW